MSRAHLCRLSDWKTTRTVHILLTIKYNSSVHREFRRFSSFLEMFGDRVNWMRFSRKMQSVLVQWLCRKINYFHKSKNKTSFRRLKSFYQQSIDSFLISDVQLKINEKSSICFALSNPSSPASYILQNKQKVQVRLIAICPHKRQSEAYECFYTNQVYLRVVQKFEDSES